MTLKELNNRLKNVEILFDASETAYLTDAHLLLLEQACDGIISQYEQTHYEVEIIDLDEDSHVEVIK